MPAGGANKLAFYAYLQRGASRRQRFAHRISWKVACPMLGLD